MTGDPITTLALTAMRQAHARAMSAAPDVERPADLVKLVVPLLEISAAVITLAERVVARLDAIEERKKP